MPTTSYWPAEVAELVTITHTADLWQVDTAAVDAGIEQLIQPGHDGTPQVGEFLWSVPDKVDSCLGCEFKYVSVA